MPCLWAVCPEVEQTEGRSPVARAFNPMQVLANQGLPKASRLPPDVPSLAQALLSPTAEFETFCMRIGYPGTKRRTSCGIALSEVVISIAISALSVAAVVSSYVLSARSADFIAYSSAADAAAQARMEQSRAAKWDTSADPLIDELVSTNFPPKVDVLDVPVVGSSGFYATNKTTITVVSANPPLKMVQVDCIWSDPTRKRTFTNTVTTYRSPDQ